MVYINKIGRRYTMLQTHLAELERDPARAQFLRRGVLSRALLG